MLPVKLVFQLSAKSDNIYFVYLQNSQNPSLIPPLKHQCNKKKITPVILRKDSACYLEDWRDLVHSMPLQEK